MDSSYGKEYDHPFKLLAQNDSDTEITKKNKDQDDLGFFAKMVKAMGNQPSEQMFDIAK